MFFRYFFLFTIAVSLFTLVMAMYFYTGTEGLAFKWAAGSAIALFLSIICYREAARATAAEFSYFLRQNGANSRVHLTPQQIWLRRRIAFGLGVLTATVAVCFLVFRLVFYVNSAGVTATITRAIYTGSSTGRHGGIVNHYDTEIKYTVDGKEYVSRLKTDPFMHKEGSQMDIRADRQNPTDIKEDAFYPYWGGPLGLGILALFLFFFSAKMDEGVSVEEEVGEQIDEK